MTTTRVSVRMSREQIWEFLTEGRKYASFRTDRPAMPAETRATYEQAERALVRFTPDERILNWDNRF
jgi:hypothetical protein